MLKEATKIYKAISHKIHLQKNSYESGDSYSPRKYQKGIHCMGERFDYVVPWEVKHKPDWDFVPEGV